jgi:signal transduction histidine kinase
MPDRTTSGKSSLKILHIEDSPENRMLVRAVLEAEGYTLVEAEDGLAGIEAAIREEPALILLDINLPGVDGYEVAGIIKSFPALALTPLIAVTAYAMEGDRERILTAGCDGYIQKPIDVDTFPVQVAEFLQGKRERVEEREEGLYLRELNQRLVYRLLNQVEELKRLNRHFVRRAGQLETLHLAVQEITSEVDVQTLLERLLPDISRALGTKSLTVELSGPPNIRVAVGADDGEHEGLVGSALKQTDDWSEVEWTIPLSVRDRQIGLLIARQVIPAGAKADEEQLLKIVANQVALAVENSRLYMGVQRQMAELKRAQSQLVQSAKLAAIGELTANIAHEINNPLTTVLGFASLLAQRVKPGFPMREELDLIQQEAIRARDIVRDLLDFSRQREFFPKLADLNEVLRHTVGMIRRQAVVGNIAIDEHYADGLPMVEVDESQMKQVFLNLINNAIYAMPEGGTLTVRTLAGEDVAQVELTDTGTGIAPEHIDRIFDPFFTTKPEVSGTGLGLSVSLGIVQRHGGAIEVRSEAGKGATFLVTLPVQVGAHDTVAPGDREMLSEIGEDRPVVTLGVAVAELL